ncbi:MAG: GYD domain-containing protein [Acidobacteria bacterium]|nr:GYD domain-containing protein [Acidobacteriota bacterium]
MQTFILATKLNTEGMHDLDEVKENGRRWKARVEEKCPEVKFIGHYFVFGQYDFISIYEAPDTDTAAKVSLISQSLGAQKAESWTAIPYGEFLGIIDSVK